MNMNMDAKEMDADTLNWAWHRKKCVGDVSWCT